MPPVERFKGLGFTAAVRCHKSRAGVVLGINRELGFRIQGDRSPARPGKFGISISLLLRSCKMPCLGLGYPDRHIWSFLPNPNPLRSTEVRRRVRPAFHAAPLHAASG